MNWARFVRLPAVWLAVLVGAAIAILALVVGPAPRELHLGAQLVVIGRPRALALLGLVPLSTLALLVSLAIESPLRRTLAAIVRALLLAALAIALAQPSIVRIRDDISTVFLVDVSRSMDDAQLTAAQKYVDDARREKRAGDQLRLITFATHPRVVPLPADGEALPPLTRPTAGEDSETNLELALELARALHPVGFLRRVVVLSDGNETVGDALAATAADATNQRISYVSLAREQKDEVLVRAVRLPDDARIGAPFVVDVEIYATRAQPATVTLYRDDLVNPLDGKRQLDLAAGKNLLHFRSEVALPGTTVFRAEVKPATPANDQIKENNSATAAVAVRGRPRVLYIEGDSASSVHLASALRKSDIDVEIRAAYGLPRSARELDKFDLVLLSDVKAAFVGPDQMAALETYVKDLGGGFIMAGGEDSFGSGGYQGSTIERMLPVRFDAEKKRDQPSLALALVIDRSGSMSGERIELAKEAARVTSEVLSNDDLIAVIAFDSVPTSLVRLQRASNRLRIASEIARLNAGGGTNILPALREAFVQLDPIPAKLKHVILLTDGKASYDGIRQMVDQMTERKITISAVGIGADTDKTLLTMIAERGNGRFYYTDDAQSIPRIFLKETTQVARSSLVETPSAITVVRRAELLDGVEIDKAPPLLGYVSVREKPLSEPILRIGQGEPLLSRWRYGLGQTAVWTSDVKNRWGARWVSWAGYPRFFAQLVRSTMRQQASGSGLPSYDMTVEVTPPHAHVTIDAIDRQDHFVSGLGSMLEVIDPVTKKKIAERRLIATSPGRYESTFTLDRYGSFVVRAVQSRDGVAVADTQKGISLPYPKEFLALPPDEERLAALSSLTGGSKAGAAAALWQPGTDRLSAEQPAWQALVLGAILLLLLDLILRRLPDSALLRRHSR